MKSVLLIVAAAAMTMGSSMAQAQEPAKQAGPAQIEHGKAVFQHWCAPCHGPGPGHPGTQALEARYQGAVPAALAERPNLPPEFVSAIVRNGLSIMPFFRKTEISDADLRDLGAYLARDTAGKDKH